MESCRQVRKGNISVCDRQGRIQEFFKGGARLIKIRKWAWTNQGFLSSMCFHCFQKCPAIKMSFIPMHA